MSDAQREVLPVKVPSDKALTDLAKWNDRNGSLVHGAAWYELMELVMLAERTARNDALDLAVKTMRDNCANANIKCEDCDAIEEAILAEKKGDEA